MTGDQFKRACDETLWLLNSRVPTPVRAVRVPGRPTSLPHLAWCIDGARELYVAGLADEAMLSLGFVQGVLAASCWVTMEELDAANGTDGDLPMIRVWLEDSCG